MSKRESENKIIEAYKILESRNLLPFIFRIKKQIALKKFSSQEKYVSSFIFGSYKANAEICARQKLDVQLITLDFNGKLSRSVAFNERLEHPLPKEWQIVLEEEGVSFAKIYASFQFRLFVFVRYIQSLVLSFRILGSAFYSKQNKISGQPKYVQFCDLTDNCIPWQGAENDFTVINWYINWEGRVKDCKEIHHNLYGKTPFTYKSCSIAPSNHFIRYLSETKAKFKLLYWFIGSAIISFFTFLAGKWINAYLFYEALQAKIIDLTNEEFVAKEYLFSISAGVWRPLWTYAAEKKGALITNYSYASSFGGFKNRNGYADIEYHFEISTWPRLLYWREEYISFIQSKVNPKIEVINLGKPLYYSDYSYHFPEIPRKSIAVFDISPLEPLVSAKLLPELEYRTFENGKQFLLDIYDVFGKEGYTIVWKRKRGFKTSHHSQTFISFCDEYEKLPNVIVIDPNVSAFHVVQKCNYCISMPFTSTSFIGEYYNKASIFYDASKILYKDDHGAQGILLISGKDELIEWRKNLEQ